MLVAFQAATNPAQGWQWLEAEDWAGLPKRPLPRNPRGTDQPDEQLGWYNALCIQGLMLRGDHYAVEPLSRGRVRATVWSDDIEDFPDGGFWALVWTFQKMRPLARFQGALSTDQYLTMYCDAAHFAALPAIVQERGISSNGNQAEIITDWGAFVPPPDAITRHGIWTGGDSLSGLTEELDAFGVPSLWENLHLNMTLLEVDEHRFEMRPGVYEWASDHISQCIASGKFSTLRGLPKKHPLYDQQIADGVENPAQVEQEFDFTTLDS